MEKIKLLVVCAEEEILETMIRLLGKEEKWEARGAGSAEKAIRLFQEDRFDLVLLGSGIDAESESGIVRKCREKDPGIKIVQHFGGGGGLLFNEILAALSDNPDGNIRINGI